MQYDLRAVGSGYFRVFVNGEQVSQHLQEREAAEAATERKLSDPMADVYYDHDYRVVVDYTPSDVPPPDPMPDPVPDPTPDPTPDPDPTPPPVPAGPSPHYAHATFGGVDYIIHYMPTTDQPAYYDFVADNYDVVVGGTTAQYLGRNPTIDQLCYDLIWCLDAGRQAAYEAFLAAHGFPVEAGFIHKPGTSATTANRLQAPIQGKPSVFPVMGSAGYQAFLRAQVKTLTSAGARSVFYDVTSAWDVKQAINGPTLEYPTVDAWYQDLYSALRIAAQTAPAGYVMPNTATSTTPQDTAIAVAAGSTFMEWANDPSNERGFTCWPFIQDLLRKNVRVMLAPRREAQYLAQPYPNTTGQAETMYGDVRTRDLVNEYANYLMNVDQSNIRGLILSLYTAAVGVSQYVQFPHRYRWLEMFAVDIGQAVGAAQAGPGGTDGAGQPFQAYLRQFTKGLVVYRPMQNWARTAFGNSTATDIALPAGTWKQLMPDASVRAAVSTIRLRNGEAAIFVGG